MDGADQYLNLIERLALDRARSVATSDSYTAAAFASVAYERALIRASELAVQESVELLSRLNGLARI